MIIAITALKQNQQQLLQSASAVHTHIGVGPVISARRPLAALRHQLQDITVHRRELQHRPHTRFNCIHRRHRKTADGPPPGLCSAEGKKKDD